MPNFSKTIYLFKIQLGSGVRITICCISACTFLRPFANYKLSYFYVSFVLHVLFLLNSYTLCIFKEVMSIWRQVIQPSSP